MEEQEKKISKKMSQFVVIGLGRFGRSLATKLSELGKEVLCIDKDENAVKQMQDIVSAAVVADSTQKDVLHSLGVQNFDCAINCIGGDLQSSILTTLLCKELGVKCVVAKAKNEQNKKVLEKIGADLVVFPEAIMGKKVASMLANPSINEVMNLTNNFEIVEMPNIDDWEGKSIIDINVRKKYKVSIIFVKRENKVIYPEPETILLKDDILVVAGEKSKIEALSKMTKDVIDFASSLNSF